MVCSWARASLALRYPAGLLAVGANSIDETISPTAGTDHDRPDDRGVDLGSGKSAGGDSHPRRSANAPAQPQRPTLKRLQVFQQLGFRGRRKIGPVVVTRVRVAGRGRVKRRGARVVVAHRRGIVALRTSAEGFRPLVRRSEQFRHRADGAVVQIWRARPYSVERGRPILSRAANTEFPRPQVIRDFQFGEELVEIGRQFWSEKVSAARVGLYLGDGMQPLVALRPAVTGSAGAREMRRTAFRCRVIDGKWKT